MTTSGFSSTNGFPADPAAAPDSSLPMRSALDVISDPPLFSPLLPGGAAQADRSRPFLDLALDEIRKVAGTALFRRHHIKAEVFELAAHRRIVHHFRKRS